MNFNRHFLFREKFKGKIKHSTGIVEVEIYKVYESKSHSFI